LKRIKEFKKIKFIKSQILLPENGKIIDKNKLRGKRRT